MILPRKYRIVSPDPEESKFDIQIQELFEKDDLRGRSLVKFISRIIKNSRIDLEPMEVMSIAYLRGREHIRKGGSIRKPSAWLRATCTNIVREKVRNNIKEESVYLDISASLNTDESDERLKEISRIRESFERLSEDDRQVIKLKFFEDKTYEEMTYLLNLDESQDLETRKARVRKRVQRAMKRLLMVYQELASVR